MISGFREIGRLLERRYLLIGTLLMAQVTLFLAPAARADEEPVVRIEEDWEIVILSVVADPLQDACPQWETWFSANTLSPYFGITWNYRWNPYDEWGGYEIDGYGSGPDPVVYECSEHPDRLWAPCTLKWTQAMEVDSSDPSDPKCAFAVVDGSVVLEGASACSLPAAVFGNTAPASSTTTDGHVTAIMSGLPDLTAYDADDSALWSSVYGLGTQRVKLMRITEVRKYGATGLISRDRDPKVAWDIIWLQ